MYQFYVIEIQKHEDGEYGHIVHYAYDEDKEQARRKAESKYHEVLAAAAVSGLPSHSACLIASDGFPIMHQCYKVEKQEVIPE